MKADRTNQDSICTRERGSISEFNCVSAAPESEISGVFDCSDFVVHNQATVVRNLPLTVMTDIDQWSYAIAFRLRLEAPPSRPASDSFLVRITATVESGRIGMILVSGDLRNAVGTHVDGSPRPDGEVTFEIRTDSLPQPGWLVIRNNAAGSIPSKCTVKDIRVFRTRKIPEAHRVAAMRIQQSGLAGDVLEILRTKWSEVPAGLTARQRTTELLQLSDGELKTFWMQCLRETTTGDGFAARGWYQELYKDIFRNRRVLDVGAGLGIDGLTFARHGACVTFLDIVVSNLDLLKRLCHIFGVKGAQFHYLGDLSSLDRLPKDFYAIWCQGSLINAPFHFVRQEVQSLLSHLPVGGRWVQLAYPRERWERDGCMPFNEWGNFTDGFGTPWMEWYDLERLHTLLEPAAFDVILHFNFHNNDFNWFDLIRTK